MNKTILVSLSLIAVVGAIVIGGTYAYFSQSITAEDNTFSAGTMTMTLSGKSEPILGPALKAQNFYPGAFAESASVIANTPQGIAFNPEISLANANDPDNMADYLYLEVWTNGKLWYKNWIKSFPGYTSGKLVLDTIQPGEDQIVAFRLIMVETAPDSLQGKNYSVDVVVTAHQWNNPSYPVSTPVDSTHPNRYVANDWSFSVCGVRQPNHYPAIGANGNNSGGYDTTKYSPYFSYSIQGASPWGWKVQAVPASYQGGTTQLDIGGTYSCTVK